MSTHGSLIGSRLGEFEVEALIGRGAMGAVYLARDGKLGRHVALKVLLGSLARSPEIVRQFHQEAQATAPLKHPGIVRIYTAGTEGGVPFIAMEYVDGEPLDRFLRRKRKVSWDIALHIGGQIADALEGAHTHGIVHRDVKPQNIMLDRKGRVRLTDFGIARVQSEESGPSGEVLGTPQYMSPEQVTGGEVGPASDLFSLGVVLYQMISGELPFHGESSMALVKSICEDSPPRLNRLEPAVPDDVARLVAYLIEKEPGKRPASARVASGLIRRLQKQRGANTAIADSLTQFLKEEMEPQALGGRLVPTRKRGDSKIRKMGSDSRRLPAWLTPKVVAHAIGVVAMVAGAFALGPWTAARARVQTPPAAPGLDLATFQAGDVGSRRVLFFLDGFELSSVSWAESGAGLLVDVRGERGALTDGARGLLSVDLAEEEIYSLVPPETDPESATVTGFRRETFTTQAYSLDGSENDRVLVAGWLPDGAYAMFSQAWLAASPHPRVLYRSAADGGTGSMALAPVAASPDGETVLVARTADDGSIVALHEREIAAVPYDALGPNRLSETTRARQGSVQYTRDGRRIAYLREEANGLSSLWMLRSGGADRGGREIAKGVVGETYSLSPDGERVLLVRRVGQRSPRVELIDTREGTIVTTLGRGTVCRDSWLPDSSRAIFAGVNASGALQLMTVENMANARPYAVTTFRNGVRDDYAVGPEGARVAVVGEGERIPTIHVLDLKRLMPRG